MPVVAVGLSGGVDSAVAALTLQEQGHTVLGLTMQTWDGSIALPDTGRSGCFGPGEARDIESAAAVARRLGIAHHVIGLSGEYRGSVLDYFRTEYLAGRTPNPCVRCNATVKFGALIKAAAVEGIRFDLFATGHYSRLIRNGDRAVLCRAKDRRKDQSYFLSGLSQAQLSRMLLPLGDMTKAEVKAKARKAGWKDLADKPESQDFIECDRYDALFRPEDHRPGPIRDLDGEVLGEHQGIARYTVGQRKGVARGGGRRALYVVGIDAAENSVIVGPKEALLVRSFEALEVRWHAGWPPDALLRLCAQVRSRHPGADALVTPASGDRGARIEFDEPQSAVTPGQAAVLYDADAVFAAGVIGPTVRV
ncbi:MAG: tRNA 2-thiouridine(34) synthase MnmA [Elusimicrobia bacterium]|nr:tRNA 2-thiouridine(34) synthase MnmA [Elusimicrobiota bacterium]